jgi:hypothetical protein
LVTKGRPDERALRRCPKGSGRLTSNGNFFQTPPLKTPAAARKIDGLSFFTLFSDADRWAAAGETGSAKLQGAKALALRRGAFEL